MPTEAEYKALLNLRMVARAFSFAWHSGRLKNPDILNDLMVDLEDALRDYKDVMHPDSSNPPPTIPELETRERMTPPFGCRRCGDYTTTEYCSTECYQGKPKRTE